MGGRLSCSCPQSHALLSGDDKQLRIHAEIFELSPDGQRWQILEPRLVYVTVRRRCDEEDTKVSILGPFPGGSTSDVTATTAAGITVLSATIQPSAQMEKIAECFVYWKEPGGRCLGVNTLSARDATAFMTVARPERADIMEPPPLHQHSTMAQVTLLASWDGRKISRRIPIAETTLLSVTPLSLVFHYNQKIVDLDLLECLAVESPDLPSTLQIGCVEGVFEVQLNEKAEEYLTRVLNMSSLLLARTTCSDVAISYLNRQRTKLRERMNEVLFADPSTVRKENSEEYEMEKLSLKDIAIQQRICALQRIDQPSNKHLPSSLSVLIDQIGLSHCGLPSLHAALVNLHGYRMWRKSAEHRAADMRVLTSPGTHSSTVVPIALPNGKTTVVTAERVEPEELLGKVCHKLGVEPDLFELQKSENGWRLVLKEEYEVRKTGSKLGLTIYAHNDRGKISAEVRGVAAFAPGGPAVGDTVVSVDGRMINAVDSAADVEQLLREGTVIRLRRRSQWKKDGRPPEKSSSKEKIRMREQVPLPSAESRGKMEERLLRAISELLTTEKKYVADLNEMVERYLKIRSVSEIMECAFRLQKVQQHFLESLEEAVGEDILQNGNHANHTQVRDSVMRVCALFVNRCSDLKVYAEYAAAYLRLQQEMQQRKEILSELEAANCSGEQHLSYESRMIKPVQRIVQYPLMLRAVAAGCEKSSLEARQVESALAKMQTLAEYVNEMQRIHEQFAPHIEQVRRSQAVYIQKRALRLDIRDLLLFAHVRWANCEARAAHAQDYVIFVFHTCVLLLPASLRNGVCKPKWLRLLPIADCELSEIRRDDCSLILSMSPAPTTPTHAPPPPIEPIQLACCQPQLKQQLIKSLRKAKQGIMKESRRPLSGSSLSDGGYASDITKERKMS